MDELPYGVDTIVLRMTWDTARSPAVERAMGYRPGCCFSLGRRWLAAGRALRCRDCGRCRRGGPSSPTTARAVRAPVPAIAVRPECAAGDLVSGSTGRHEREPVSPRRHRSSRWRRTKRQNVGAARWRIAVDAGHSEPCVAGAGPSVTP